MNKSDFDRINEELKTLFPSLRQRLRQLHGESLDAWLKTGRSKAITVNQNDETFLSDYEIQDNAADLFCLDIEGFDGFRPAQPLTADDCESIRQQAQKLAYERVQQSGLRQLIVEVTSGYYDNRLQDKDDAAFFIWAAIFHDDQIPELADLWILEQSPERHGYMFLLEDGAQLNQTWRCCVDILSPEILAALDQEYIDLDNAA